MRISQLAERSGIPATTLRFYENSGLITAERTASGYRSFGEDAIQRLAFIAAAKHLGLPLEEIADLLAVWQARACAEVKADLRPRIAARLAMAEQRAAEAAAFTSSLRSALEHLDALPDRTTLCDPRCEFLNHRATTPSSGSAVDLMLSPSRKAAELEAQDRRTTVVACSLNAEGTAERAAQWSEALGGAVVVEIPGGRRLTVPAERFIVVAELAAAEQQCCPFFDFRFHLDGSDLHIEVRAPAEGDILLADLFSAA